MIAIHDKIGHGFRGVRKDKRVFIGVVKSVKDNTKGTLVVVQQADGNYKSFYMHDITGGWSTSLCNGQPVLLN